MPLRKATIAKSRSAIALLLTGKIEKGYLYFREFTDAKGPLIIIVAPRSGNGQTAVKSLLRGKYGALDQSSSGKSCCGELRFNAETRKLNLCVDITNKVTRNALKKPAPISALFKSNQKHASFLSKIRVTSDTGEVAEGESLDEAEMLDILSSVGISALDGRYFLDNKGLISSGLNRLNSRSYEPLPGTTMMDEELSTALCADEDVWDLDELWDGQDEALGALHAELSLEPLVNQDDDLIEDFVEDDDHFIKEDDWSESEREVSQIIIESLRRLTLEPTIDAEDEVSLQLEMDPDVLPVAQINETGLEPELIPQETKIPTINQLLMSAAPMNSGTSLAMQMRHDVRFSEAQKKELLAHHTKMGTLIRKKRRNFNFNFKIGTHKITRETVLLVPPEKNDNKRLFEESVKPNSVKTIQGRLVDNKVFIMECDFLSPEQLPNNMGIIVGKSSSLDDARKAASERTMKERIGLKAVLEPGEEGSKQRMLHEAFEMFCRKEHSPESVGGIKSLQACVRQLQADVKANSTDSFSYQELYQKYIADSGNNLEINIGSNERASIQRFFSANHGVVSSIEDKQSLLSMMGAALNDIIKLLKGDTFNRFTTEVAEAPYAKSPKSIYNDEFGLLKGNTATNKDKARRDKDQKYYQALLKSHNYIWSLVR